jgi:PAS domain S-box-containing protein
MLGATGVALLVCTRMQRVIADPIQQLAQVTQRVATARDYSIRAKKAGDDEIGQLTDAFNQMLTEIESGDQALRRLNRIIEESEKAERKRAQTNQARLIAILEATPDFVGSADADGHMLYLNQAGRNMVGFGPDDDISSVMFNDLYPEWVVQIIQQQGLASAIRDGVWGGETALLGADGQEILLSQVLIAHRNPDGSLAYYSTVGRDITAQKRAREEMDELNRQLVATSRQAGMAEVATGVLHNVGNVLNSVSVSATLVSDRLKKSKAVNLHRATELMAQQNGRLAEFLTSDPKGKVLPEYFGTVSAQIIAEQAEMLKELTLLGQNIEHIKEIVAMQQSYAKVSGAYERLDAVELVEDAFRLNAAAFERHHIQVVREYEQNLPRVNVDRHKVLQILINLIRNAKYAMDAGRNDNKQLVLQVQRLGESAVAVRVRDNGHGISAENLTRIFQHGFTTKKEGHGFGLHSGANAAKEMGGRLVVHSDGPDQGAEFTLELPVAAARPVSTT